MPAARVQIRQNLRTPKIVPRGTFFSEIRICVFRLSLGYGQGRGNIALSGKRASRSVGRPPFAEGGCLIGIGTGVVESEQLGGSSPDCFSHFEKSMLFASILAGVPVFRRASSIPADSRLPERLLAEKSPILPPSVFKSQHASSRAEKFRL